VTTQDSQHPQTADQRIPDTEVIAVATPAPVFVDSTGRRSRMLRRMALAFGILVVSYGGLVSVSLAGGPVNSSAVLPLPGLDDEKADPVPPRPNPAPATSPATAAARPPVESTVTPARPVDRPVAPAAEPVRPAKSAPARTTKAPAAKPAPAKVSPTPTASTTKPTESTTTTPAANPTTSSKAPEPAPPAPPAPPVTRNTTKSEPAALPTLGPTLADDPADTGTPAPSSSRASA
jgi:hypothetical protein